MTTKWLVEDVVVGEHYKLHGSGSAYCVVIGVRPFGHLVWGVYVIDVYSITSYQEMRRIESILYEVLEDIPPQNREQIMAATDTVLAMEGWL